MQLSILSSKNETKSILSYKDETMSILSSKDETKMFHLFKSAPLGAPASIFYNGQT